MRGPATIELPNRGLVAAHPSLPINSKIKIKNPKNDIEIDVTIINHIQPSLHRIIDISRDAGAALGIRSGDHIIISTYAPMPAEPAETVKPVVAEAAPVEKPPSASIVKPEQGKPRIHIAPVLGRSDQAAFIQFYFEAEADAAGYVLVRNCQEACYTLILEVMPNNIMFNDGTEEPAPPEEEQYRLHLWLFKNEANVELTAEILTFYFLFTDLNILNAHIPYIFDEAMANVPVNDWI